VALIGTIAVVVSVLVLAYQGRELAGHTRIANEVAGTQAHRELLFHWKSVLDVFLRHPELHGQYFGTVSDDASPNDAVRLAVIAEQHADWLDTGLMTERQLGSFPTLFPEWMGGWHDFSMDALGSSPVLRALIRSRPNEWSLLDPLLADYDQAHQTRPALDGEPSSQGGS
jgi:hypothetical protein